MTEIVSRITVPVAAAFLMLSLTACEQSKNEVATMSPTQASSSGAVQNNLLHSRAVEAAVWSIPAVNYDLMLQEMLTKTPGKVGQVIYWGRPLDWRNQTLTPNPDALYFISGRRRAARHRQG